jgi:hypothetical protein
LYSVIRWSPHGASLPALLGFPLADLQSPSKPLRALNPDSEKHHQESAGVGSFGAVGVEAVLLAMVVQ